MEIKFNTHITVDSALSTTSENPVQNKVVTQAINKNKVTVDSSLSTTSENPVQNKVIAAALANITPSESKSFTFWVNASNSGSQKITTNTPVFITYFESGTAKGISSTESSGSYSAEIIADANSFVTIYYNNSITSLSLSGFSFDTFDSRLLPKTVRNISLTDSQCTEFFANNNLRNYNLSSIGLENFSFTNDEAITIEKLLLNNNKLTSFFLPFLCDVSSIYLNDNNLESIDFEGGYLFSNDIKLYNNRLKKFDVKIQYRLSELNLSNNLLETFEFSNIIDSIDNLYLSNNKLITLDGSNLEHKTYNLFLDNNPFASDETEAENFANSLPDISIGSQNISFASTDTQFSLIQSIATPKGWYVYQN